MNPRVLVLATCAVLAACGGAKATGAGRIADAERMQAGLAGRDAQTLAPQAYAEAQEALRQAKEADAAGDSTGAELQAERAVACYQRAIALARLSRATEEEASAKEALARAAEQAQHYATARKTAEREADDLEKQLKIAREAHLPAPSGPADPERERARLVAANALTTQARLLCSAARLVSPQAPGLAEAETTVADLEKKLEGSPKPAPIDAAARARSGCLAALTKARRAAGRTSDEADTLLGELSRAGGFAAVASSSSGNAPSATSSDPRAKSATDLTTARDERGVVVTLRGAFKGEALAPETEATLKDLGRVAAAHPSFGVQVVLHDATSPGAAETAVDKKRGDAASRALSAGGANTAKIKIELAGARAPVVDPSDAKRRERNARLEIVFVGT